MRRREFITLLGSVAATWPFAARAQQPTTPVVGLLGTGSLETDAYRVGAVRQGLIEAGYVEGRDVAIEYRGAEDHNERLLALATELVHREVAVIVTVGGTTSAVALKTVPKATLIGFLVNPTNAGAKIQTKNTLAAAESVGQINYWSCRPTRTAS